MYILGIESSCDETAAGVVVSGTQVLSSVLHSQIDRHRKFGGVVPEIASREHLKKIDNIVAQSLDESGLSLKDIDGIAVTQGPGLIGSLLVGITYGKGLALATGIPLIPVNHVHAHVHGALLGLDMESDLPYPFLAAVVSGGHTHLYKVQSPTKFHLIGYSVDDACGECFDKVAKLFDLGYPGGPNIEKAAKTGDAFAIEMPTLMMKKDSLNFSYSGLKTHMLNLKKRMQNQAQIERLDHLMASFQNEALGQIIRKLKIALEAEPKISAIVVAGGVAANQVFRQMTKDHLNVPTFFPRLEYCSDNGAMIAALGYHQFKEHQSHDYSWDAFSRYPYEKMTS